MRNHVFFILDRLYSYWGGILMFVSSIMLLLGGIFSALLFHRYWKTGNKRNRNAGIAMVVLTSFLLLTQLVL